MQMQLIKLPICRGTYLYELNTEASNNAKTAIISFNWN